VPAGPGIGRARLKRGHRFVVDHERYEVKTYRLLKLIAQH
jgi:hypothetical protein